MPQSISQFISHLHSLDRSPNTIQAYRLDLHQFEKWFERINDRELSPALITPTDIREFKHYLIEDEQLKPSTVNRKLASIRSFLKWAKSEDEIEELPRFPQSMEQVKSAPKALNRTEMHALVRAVERYGDSRDRAIILVLLNTGLRVNELSELNLSDVEMSERKGKVVVRSGKGQKYREVPLNAEARRAIEEYLDDRAEDNESALFLSQRESRLGTRGIQDVVSKYARFAEVEDVTPHTLRHTFCTNLLRSGKVDIVTVAQIAGHSDISTTSIYTQPNGTDMQNAVEGLVE
ncbi:MAG: tyrosine-type recombinase/integrase [Armatimonadota bacterium]